METLPKEIFDIIKSFLDGKSRRMLRVANTHWCKAVLYNDFTFNFTTKEQIPQIFQRLQKYNFPISVAFNNPKCTFTKQEYIKLSEMTQLIGLDVMQIKRRKGSLEDLWPLTNLTNLQNLDIPFHLNTTNHFLNRISLYCYVDNIQAIDLTNFTKLQSIRLSARKMAEDPRLIFPMTNNITQLEVYFNPQNVMDEDNWARLSNLKTLIIEARGSAGLNIPHLPNLESLDLVSVSNIESVGLLPKLTSFTLSRYNRVNFATFSTLTALRSFTAICYDLQQFAFMTALTNLEDLTFQAQEAEGPKSLYFNSTKLTALGLFGDYRPDTWNVQLANLKKLHLIGNRSVTADIFRNLTGLLDLDLAGVPQSAQLFRSIEELTKLKELRISPDYNEAIVLNPEDILRIENMTDLKLLEFTGFLDGNAHIDDGRIGHLPLKVLDICWPVDQKFFENISTLTSLEKLCINRANNVSDEMIQLLSGLNNLTQLVLFGAGNAFTGVTLTCLTSLQRVEMQANGGLFIDKDTLKGTLPYLHQVLIY